YHDSTLAYQGGGRGVATYWPPAFPRPDITFLLSLPVEGGRMRQLVSGRKGDRVEGEPSDFHERVAAAYESLAAAEPGRFIRLDAAESREKVHALVMERIEQVLVTRS